MKKSTFNKSDIMKQAWILYRSTFFHYTFSQALKMAWHYAKQETEHLAQVEARKAAEASLLAERLAAKPQSKNEGFYKKFGKTIAKQYRNVTFGRNDYRVAYSRRYF